MECVFCENGKCMYCQLHGMDVLRKINFLEKLMECDIPELINKLKKSKILNEAENYVKNKMTHKEMDEIDTDDPEYKKFYIRRGLEIRSHLLYPIKKEELESRIKTQWVLKKKGYLI